MLQIVKSGHTIKNLLYRNVSCTARLSIDKKWREDRGLPDNPTEFGPLTNLPDYTFLDGRPTPMGSNLKRRLGRQKEIAAMIVNMTKELDFAKKRYKQMQTDKEVEKQNILGAKLKPKGKCLLEGYKN